MASAPQALLLTPNFVMHTYSTSVDASDSTAKSLCSELEKRKCRSPIFSVDIHSDNEHIATGGNDHFVRLWSLSAIIADSTFQSPTTPRELFAGKRHDGTVMCVRWTHGTKALLATAADDGSIIIWKLEKKPAIPTTITTITTNTMSNSSTLNISSKAVSLGGTYSDSLTFVHKLPSMNSDVIDLTWSHDNKFLASCSLDNTISIWSGSTFARVAVCTHKSFVKGVSFDPAGQYLVSQSDDGSTILWNTQTWKQFRRLAHPFLQSLSSAAGTVLRPSWSPDGDFVACAGAVSEGVHVAVVLPRKQWGIPRHALNLVGHNAAIAVARFGPVCYMHRGAHINLLAVGAVDGRLSIWAMNHTPLLMLDKMFESEITDITWSQDGRTVLACAREGRVGGIWVTDVARCLLGDGATPISRPNVREYLRKSHVLVLPPPPSLVPTSTSTSTSTTATTTELATATATATTTTVQPTAITTATATTVAPPTAKKPTPIGIGFPSTDLFSTPFSTSSESTVLSTRAATSSVPHISFGRREINGALLAGSFAGTPSAKSTVAKNLGSQNGVKRNILNDNESETALKRSKSNSPRMAPASNNTSLAENGTSAATVPQARQNQKVNGDERVQTVCQSTAKRPPRVLLQPPSVASRRIQPMPIPSTENSNVEQVCDSETGPREVTTATASLRVPVSPPSPQSPARVCALRQLAHVWNFDTVVVEAQSEYITLWMECDAEGEWAPNQDVGYNGAADRQRKRQMVQYQRQYIGPGRAEIAAASHGFVAIVTGPAVPTLFVYNVGESQFAIRGLVLGSAARQLSVLGSFVAILTACDWVLVYSALQPRCLVRREVRSITYRHSDVRLVLEAPLTKVDEELGFRLALRTASGWYRYNHALSGFCQTSASPRDY